MNTTLDDLSAVVGFSATLKLVAWFGDGVSNLFVPAQVEDGQVLVRLLGRSAAVALSKAFPGKHLAVPGLRAYELEGRRRTIARLTTKGLSRREIAGILKMSERRIQQIESELLTLGLIMVQQRDPDCEQERVHEPTPDAVLLTAMAVQAMASKTVVPKADKVTKARAVGKATAPATPAARRERSVTGVTRTERATPSTPRPAAARLEIERATPPTPHPAPARAVDEDLDDLLGL